ncbi:FadR family transcriptional regulator [Planosporangium thailandense]|uniref:FadR family transcriptional regulator n=1 Tax=Planosporangium thailandense TaxID=765197 RepID=A0ABX0Y730_9ACTN|nr:FCD domain-containing protein [Planosporangium thailandense]NJC73235.1 FadR family transcriptional regulator [Planosporangium thailandense]
MAVDRPKKQPPHDDVVRSVEDQAFAAFYPINASRAFQEVVDQLTYVIRAGIYPVGSRLPTVEALARQMNVSRPTVGEALGVLATYGVVETRRGATGGTKVISSAIPTDLMRLSGRRFDVPLRQLAEARRVIEMELARLAGLHATEEHFAELQRAIDLLEPARGRPADWVHANDLFHYTIAKAADNEPLAVYSHELMEQLAIVLDGFDESYTDFEHTVHIHEATLAALRSRSESRIKSVMDEHLREIEEVATWFDSLSPEEKANRPTIPSVHRRPGASGPTRHR